MKVLVTGGTGFIGSNIVNKLLDAGREVLITGLEDITLKNPKLINLGRSFHNLDWDKIGKIDVFFTKRLITTPPRPTKRRCLR